VRNEGENNVEFAGKTAIHSTPIMISPLVSKVKLSHLVESTDYRDCSLVEVIGNALRFWYVEVPVEDMPPNQPSLLRSGQQRRLKIEQF
jgi:hypothetical protein